LHFDTVSAQLDRQPLSRLDGLEDGGRSLLMKLSDPGNLEETLGQDDSARRKELPEDLQALRKKRQKLQHGIDRLIDSFADGVIDKDQFTSRMNRAKARLADLERKIAAQAANEERRVHIQSAMGRLTELSHHLESQLKEADWGSKREIMRAIIQRIEIAPTNIAIVLRLSTKTSARSVDPIVMTLSRA
jgi:site-specific DNA recombinase